MFGRQHALFKALGRVAYLDRNLGASEHLAGVELFGHQMHRATAYAVARCDGSGMSVPPLVFGKERWVDVDDPAAPLIDEPGREDAHEARERDGADFMFLERVAQH